MWTYSSKQCLSLMAQIDSFMTVNRKLTRFQMRVENKDYHQLLGEHLGPSISGVFTISCIFSAESSVKTPQTARKYREQAVYEVSGILLMVPKEPNY
jgi:hypothetical protein